MNETLQTIYKRRSHRSFTDLPVEKAVIEQIVNASITSPSARNLQSSRIIVMENNDLIEELRTLGIKITGRNSDPFYGAKTIILVVGDTSSSQYLLDGSSLLTTMILAAESLNIGTCWINCVNQLLEHEAGEKLRQALQITSFEKVVGTCIMGYKTTEDFPPIPRKKNYITHI